MQVQLIILEKRQQLQARETQNDLIKPLSLNLEETFLQNHFLEQQRMKLMLTKLSTIILEELLNLNDFLLIISLVLNYVLIFNVYYNK
jgi:hypothetical protein